MPNVYISNETVDEVKEIINTEVHRQAGRIQCEPALIKALIKKESAGMTNAFRIDYSVLVKQSWYSNTLTEEEKGNPWFYSSAGVMQVLYGTARHLGYTGDLAGLFNVQTGMHWGCEYLKNLLKRYDDIQDIISAYNAGSPRKTAGVYRNQAYVSAVYKSYKSFGGKL